MSQKQKKPTQIEPGGGDGGKGPNFSKLALAKAKAKEAQAILKKLDGSVKVAAKEDAKQAWMTRQKQVRTIMICCCGDPGCWVGPFTRSYKVKE